MMIDCVSLLHSLSALCRAPMYRWSHAILCGRTLQQRKYGRVDLAGTGVSKRIRSLSPPAQSDGNSNDTAPLRTKGHFFRVDSTKTVHDASSTRHNQGIRSPNAKYVHVMDLKLAANH